jgi:hypothetical protein
MKERDHLRGRPISEVGMMMMMMVIIIIIIILKEVGCDGLDWIQLAQV